MEHILRSWLGVRFPRAHVEPVMEARRSPQEPRLEALPAAEGPFVETVRTSPPPAHTPRALREAALLCQLVLGQNWTGERSRTSPP